MDRSIESREEELRNLWIPTLEEVVEVNQQISDERRQGIEVRERELRDFFTPSEQEEIEMTEHLRSRPILFDDLKLSEVLEWKERQFPDIIKHPTDRDKDDSEEILRTILWNTTRKLHISVYEKPWVRNMYEYTRKYCTPDGRILLYDVSDKKTGKSEGQMKYAAREHYQAVLKGEKFRILCIGSRKSFETKQTEDFTKKGQDFLKDLRDARKFIPNGYNGIVMHNYIDFIEPSIHDKLPQELFKQRMENSKQFKDLSVLQCLAIQLDSILKIKEHEYYDIIFLDEIISTLRHFRFNKMKWPIEIVAKLRVLISKAKQVFFSDADVTTGALEILEELCSEIELDFVLRINKFVKDDRDFFRYEERAVLAKYMYEGLVVGKKYICPCVNKGYANRLYVFFKKMFPRKTIELITAETTLSLSSSWWGECDLLIHTAVIEFGTNFTEFHFDAVISFAQKGIVTAKQLLQMWYRARNTYEDSVHFHVAEKTKNDDCTFLVSMEQVLESNSKKKKAYASRMPTLTDQTRFNILETSLDAKIFNMINIQNTIEARTNEEDLLGEILKQLEKTTLMKVPVIIRNDANYKLEMKDIKKKIREKEIESIANARMISLSEAQDIRRNYQRSLEQEYELRRFEFVEFYAFQNSQVTYENIVLFYPKMKILRNFQEIWIDEDTELHRRDNNRFSKSRTDSYLNLWSEWDEKLFIENMLYQGFNFTLQNAPNYVFSFDLARERIEEINKMLDWARAIVTRLSFPTIVTAEGSKKLFRKVLKLSGIITKEHKIEQPDDVIELDDETGKPIKVPTETRVNLNALDEVITILNEIFVRKVNLNGQNKLKDVKKKLDEIRNGTRRIHRPYISSLDTVTEAIVDNTEYLRHISRKKRGSNRRPTATQRNQNIPRPPPTSTTNNRNNRDTSSNSRTRRTDDLIIEDDVEEVSSGEIDYELLASTRRQNLASNI